MRELSWTRGSDERRVPSGSPHDELVRRLSSGPSVSAPSSLGNHDDGLETAAAAAPARRGAGARERRSFPHDLYHLSPVVAVTHEGDLTRRSFLKALGASMALAGLDGCTRIPAEKILPFVTQPPEFTPGIPVHYATSMVLDGYATGLVVEAHEGRPTKIEGNPDHPASLGAAGVLEQASVLQLYDPDRARSMRQGKAASTWQAFAAAMAPASLRPHVGARGAGLALLLEPTSSPLVARTLASLRSLYPDMRVYFYAPLARNEAL